MSYNTTATRHAFEARKYLPERPSICQLCCHFLEISDDLLHWMIRQSDRHAFVNRALLEQILSADREGRKPLVEQFFEALGFGPRVTLDSHSRQGSLVMDFNRNLARDYQYTEQFDFVENSGTTEHVFDQRSVFENIHNLCRVGGVMLHRCPMMGVSNIMLYHLTPAFFYAIALANRYEILDVRVGNRWGDTVEAQLPQKSVSPGEDFRSALPAVPGFARGVGKEGRRANRTWYNWRVPRSLRLPDSLEFDDVMRKTPLTNLEHPLSRVCHALMERARRFRPECPGELYTMMLLRKTSDAPFQVPYQNNCLKDIESIEMRERYRNQFEALGVPIHTELSLPKAA